MAARKVSLVASTLCLLLGAQAIDFSASPIPVPLYSGFIVPDTISAHGPCRTQDDWAQVFKSIQAWYEKPGSPAKTHAPTVQISSLDCDDGRAGLKNVLGTVLDLARETGVKVLLTTTQAVIQPDEGPAADTEQAFSRLSEILKDAGCDGLLGVITRIESINVGGGFADSFPALSPDKAAAHVGVARTAVHAAHASCAGTPIGYEASWDRWHSDEMAPVVREVDLLVQPFHPDVEAIGKDKLVKDFKDQYFGSVEKAQGKQVYIGRLGWAAYLTLLGGSADLQDSGAHGGSGRVSRRSDESTTRKFINGLSNHEATDHTVSPEILQAFFQQLVCDGTLDGVNYWWNGAFDPVDGSDGREHDDKTPAHPDDVIEIGLTCTTQKL